MKRIQASAAPLRAALTALLLGACLVQVSPALGQANPNPPERMTYQGFLVGSDGVALGNANPKNYDVVFRIYDVENGGAPLWGEQQTVTVDKGYFNVLLGEGSAVGARPALSSLFKGATASDRFVGITVQGIGAGGANVDILPRLRLMTSPYAFLAQNAVKLVQDNASGTDLITSIGDAVTLNGRLGIVGNRELEFGAGVAGKEGSAGMIGYEKFTTGALDIVGAGTTGSDRKVKVWAEGGLTVGGPVTADSFTGFGTIPLGGIIMWSGGTAPAGWALCDGGTVNGRVTPDLRGRFVLGAGSGSGLTPRSVGQTGGTENTTLTAANLPPHNHTIGVRTVGYTSSYNGGAEATGAPDNSGRNNGSQTFTTSSTGSATSFNNMPPFYVLAYIMRVQ